MTTILEAIDNRIGGRLNAALDAFNGMIEGCKAIAKGEATIQLPVRMLTEEEKRAQFSAALAKQVAGKSEAELKALQAEIHRTLNAAKR